MIDHLKPFEDAFYQSTFLLDPSYWVLLSDMECNETCCEYDDGKMICFTDYNFTDTHNLGDAEPWELAVRWTFIIPVVILGVFGNFAIITILFKNKLLMRMSMNLFILNLAISDMIFAIAGPIPFTIRDTHQFWILGEVWCHLDGYIQVTVMLVSVLSLATISVDRMLGILFPMHQHLKMWQAMLIIAFIWVFSASFAVPFYIYRNYGVRQWKDLTEIYCDEVTSKEKIWWIIIIVLLNWVPLTVMCVSYILIFLGFKKYAMKVEGKEHPGILKMKRKYVKMLFTVILVFCFCWLPFQAFIIFREVIIIEDSSQVNSNQELYNLMFTITQYIVYLNPMINPFVYGFMHSNFKKGFLITFPCFFKGKPKYVLTASFNGTQAYVWNQRRRHTIHMTYDNNRKLQERRKAIRRTISFTHTPETTVTSHKDKERRLAINVLRTPNGSFRSVSEASSNSNFCLNARDTDVKKCTNKEE